MANRYTFYNDVMDEKTKTNMKGLLKDPKFYEVFYSSNMSYFTIPIQLQYRPDLIAYRFYRDSSYDWILTFVNGITDSPEGYYVGKILLIPELSKIKQVV